MSTGMKRISRSRPVAVRRGRPEEPGEPVRPRRGRVVTLTGAALVVVGVVIGGAALGLGGGDRPAPRADVTMRITTIASCTLTESQSFSAVATYGAAQPLPLQAQGLITWLPQAGTTVHEGETLIRVDDRPVVLLYGAVPQYRTLRLPAEPTAGQAATGQTADRGSAGQATGEASTDPDSTETATGPLLRGADVRQLKRALTRLGYAGLDDRKTYTRSTADAVRRWQRDLGERPTGEVGLGDIFYASGPLRIVPGEGVTVGQAMSPTALERTSRTRVITATVDGTSTWARIGTRMNVDIENGDTVRGVISSVKLSDATGSDGGQSLDIVLRVARQSALKKAGVAVSVTHVTAHRAGVLCVPSAALIALAEGGYGVQTASGSYVAVKTGLFAGGKAEISGVGVYAGLQVSLPVGD
ncbi:peptidoglycan-binding protein [Kineosporia sp. J2-2]|uniref:Peptidoglycan-binding protein n=1 Tax=Kineosporia corallincola TaxID=2835133 RepID=A0ABS5TBK1_9ACTN|nr:peptidoglycan-binding domain-containing protein [Kineosporia corallincola]MBT0768430.1 peptidoglycan-binding protein [Kineosporia corallincola]